MHTSLKTLSLIALSGLLMFTPVLGQNKKATTKVGQTENEKRNMSAPQIEFTVSMTKPWTHLLEVEARISSPSLGPDFELVMPVWTPGSYLVREYARHVQDFAVKDSTGNTIAWEKTEKNSWRISNGGAKAVVVTYRVYANELTVRTNELNSEHAFFNNGALLMHPRNWISAASTVKINPYSNWKVATGLPKVPGTENTFRASNFDILYDSPFEVGDFVEVPFTVQGKKHRFVFCGDGNYDGKRVATDTAKIIEEAYKIFGELPYEDYTFIVNLRGGGGLEHLNSTALQANKYSFRGPRYTDFLSLVAHEYFHLWNVKRIRPDALGPFDYSNENYTKSLWVAEGVTSYFESLLLRRAGLISDAEFLSGKAGQIEALQERPGRFQTSAEEASFDAWIKYYRPDENSINNQISYYDKGEILGFLLDMEIRSKSGGSRSLDDVMRHLYNEFFKKNRNYSPKDVQDASELMAGQSLDSFFSKYVRGREEIDYNSILGNFGLRMSTSDQGSREQTYLGATYSQQGERLTVTSITAGSPAWEQGLNTGDQLLAMDGQRVTQQNFAQYISWKKPGDKITLTVFRFDEILNLTVTLGGRIPPDFRINSVENPNATQMRLYKDYLKADLR